MGFMDTLGSGLGKMAALAQEIQNYKMEYEGMSDADLKRESNALRSKGGTEMRNRRAAIQSVLNDRGYHVN